MLAPLPAGAVPAELPYVGRLSFQASGAPFAGNVAVQARIYDDVLAGDLVWTGATLPTVAVQAGMLAFVLEGGTPALADVNFSAGPLWLEVSVNGTPLLPRQKLSSVPFALEAGNAEQLGGLEPTAYLLTDDDATVLSLTATEGAWLGGGLRVGDSPEWATCAVALAGAIRFNPMSANLELCDGASWKPLLDSADQITTLPFSALTGVPSTFADGVDNDTTYSPGLGLSLQGTVFAANPAVLQRRVSGACPPGQAIAAVAEDGTPTCIDVGPTDSGPWEEVPSTSHIRYAGGRVGVGPNSPSVALDVQGSLRIADGGETCGPSIEGAFRWNATSKKPEVCNGTNWMELGAGGSGGGAPVTNLGSEGLVMFAHNLAAGNNGGTPVANAWTTRPLNTELIDTLSLSTLSNNQFTLPAGSYVVEASQSFGSHVNVSMQFRSRLRNLTDNRTEAISTVCRLHLFTGSSVSDNCDLMGAFTIDGTKTFALQYWVEGAVANVGLGFGAPDNSGEPVRFATVAIRRIADSGACGATEGLPAASCQAVRQCGLYQSGVYWLDSDGLNTGNAPFQAWCDLQMDGGGWTLIGSYASGSRLESFNPALPQLTTTTGGTSATASYYPTPTSTQYGHMPYTRFNPSGREVMLTCGLTSDNPTQHRYTSSSLISAWTQGDKGTYGTVGSPGWGHLSISPSTAGRGNFWLCGISAVHPQWGIAYCSGNATTSSFGNHLASFNNQAGNSAIGCAGVSGSRLMVWIR
jgi:hypothetical protein